MRPELTRTLLVDAVIVAVLVALALILAPGYAVVGLFALLILLFGAITIFFSALRGRRRRKRLGARRRAAPERPLAYGQPRRAAGELPTQSASRRSAEPEAPQVRRVPPSRRPQTRRKPLP